MAFSKSCGVYAIINQKSYHFYIGSSKNIRDRYYTHISSLRGNYHSNEHLQFAFNKYGEKAFKFKVIYTTKDKNQACRIEQKYLDRLWNKNILYNTSKYVVYNYSNKDNPNCKITNCYNKDGILVKTYKSTAQAAKEMKVTKQSIQIAAQGKARAIKGLFWAYEGKVPIIRDSKNHDTQGAFGNPPKPVQAYNDIKLIKKFPSSREAASWCKGTTRGVRRCASGDRKSYKGYKWVFINNNINNG